MKKRATQTCWRCSGTMRINPQARIAHEEGATTTPAWECNKCGFQAFDNVQSAAYARARGWLDSRLLPSARTPVSAQEEETR